MAIWYSSAMNSITAVLDPQPDGTVHLPVPTELRGTQLRVTATLEPALSDSSKGPLVTAEMLRRRKKAFESLRRLNPFRGISDPAVWQKEIRLDRVLPGRD
jgi:hypothetical protein